MRALSGKKEPEEVADAIIWQPAVRQMLLTQKAVAEGGRSMVYECALRNAAQELRNDWKLEPLTSTELKKCKRLFAKYARRRDGKLKARAVKQGFKEDKTTADGDGFVYYSHVAKMDSIRAALSRPNWH